MDKKENLLFLFLGIFFLANVILAEIIGVKIFSVEESLGVQPFQFQFFGEKTSFNMTAGVLMWPVVFTLTDLINEYYGTKGVRILSFFAAGMILYAFAMIFLAISLSPAGFWKTSDLTNRAGLPLPNYDVDAGFNFLMGQGAFIILGSLVAFLISQFVDVFTFHRLRKITGAKKIWLRATGSTLISQLVDSFVVLGVAFYLPGKWSLGLFLAIALTNYLYKFLVAIAMTPVLLLAHKGIDAYLGKERAKALQESAAAG